MENKNSKEITKQAYQLLKWTKSNAIRKICFLVVELIFTILIAQNTKTISLLGEVLGLVNTVIIALFAVVFTGYAFFQALINDKLLVNLITSMSGEKSKLEESNCYFVQLMMLQLVVIFFNVLLLVFLIVIPDNWVLFYDNNMNTFVSGFLILLIININLEVIWEIKSFIFNLFQLFNAHAASKIMKILDDEEDEI